MNGRCRLSIDINTLAVNICSLAFLWTVNASNGELTVIVSTNYTWSFKCLIAYRYDSFVHVNSLMSVDFVLLSHLSMILFL